LREQLAQRLRSRGGVGKSGVLEHKSDNISETR